MGLIWRRLSDAEVSLMFPVNGHDQAAYRLLFEHASAGDGFEVSDGVTAPHALKLRLGHAVRQVLGPRYSLRYAPVAGGVACLVRQVKHVD
jgi:hypothetical protein